jgi:RES domain-containing protein
MLAHLTPSQLRLPYALIGIEIEDSLVQELNPQSLPGNWKDDPPPPRLNEIEWIKAGCSAALRVPSALLPQESNFLLNPEHPDFDRLVYPHRLHL